MNKENLLIHINEILDQLGKSISEEHIVYHHTIYEELKILIKGILGSGTELEWHLDYTAEKTEDALDYNQELRDVALSLKRLLSSGIYKYEQNKDQYFLISAEKIKQIELINSSTFDTSRLQILCKELNQAYFNQMFHSVLFLLRSILDHVPPLFGYKTFNEVIDNYNGGKSFKESMNYMQNSARKFADRYLHTAIRSSETLPGNEQVDFSHYIDFLLEEMISLHSKDTANN